MMLLMVMENAYVYVYDDDAGGYEMDDDDDIMNDDDGVMNDDDGRKLTY